MAAEKSRDSTRTDHSDEDLIGILMAISVASRDWARELVEAKQKKAEIEGDCARGQPRPDH